MPGNPGAAGRAHPGARGVAGTDMMRQAREGWNVYRSLVILLAVAAPTLAQTPAARLGAPIPSTIPIARGSTPDALTDGSGLPAARLGTITAARIGEGPDDASPEERYNWGARDRVRRPGPSYRERDDDRDFDTAGRGARLREPAPASPTHGRRGREVQDYDYAPAPPTPGGDPTWWPERGRDLEELRQQFPGYDRDRIAFQSDCAFDNFISPITNPFLAEDPRSLTELRPIFMYQSIPSSQTFFGGGNLMFLGTQARVAFTDRLSVVLHKAGWVFVNPSNPGVSADSVFSEIWLGPKFTFWRAPDTQTVAAAGLQFQLPVGGGGAFQDTGTFAMVPYVSFGRRIGEMDYGSFHLINVAGIHIGTDNRRSDYFFDSLHLDLDVGNYHTFYPTLELNWFHYTSNGLERPFLTFEGRDLANIGASAQGQDLVTIAPGFRYKFTDYLQMGFAVEFPIIGSRDLLQYRIGVDLIWRY
jgi:hypothetical protein